jgi:hypothetical protein
MNVRLFDHADEDARGSDGAAARAGICAESVARWLQGATMPTARAKWALGYLAGRLRAYRRGTVSLNMVAGAAGRALMDGVPSPSLIALLHQFELSLHEAA